MLHVERAKAETLHSRVARIDVRFEGVASGERGDCGDLLHRLRARCNV